MNSEYSAGESRIIEGEPTPAFEGLGIVERHNSMQRHIRLIRAQRVKKDSAEDF